MKAVIGLFSVLAVLGIAYGLAFFGVIPVQKMTAKSPALASLMTKLHLAKAKKPVQAAAAPVAANPEQQALNAQKKQLAADRAQLEKDKAAFDAQKQPAPAAADSAASVQAVDNTAKLSAIYATMSADDLARIFGKLPDPAVIASLTQIDEKKAGQVLAILPADRAARLTQQMARTPPRMQAAL